MLQTEDQCVVDAGFHPGIASTPPAEIVKLWFDAVALLRQHQGLAQEMAKLQPYTDCGLTKPILPLPESEEEAELHLYTKFPELAAAMDMMVQWNKEQILQIVNVPRSECTSLFNQKIHRLRTLGVGLYIGPDDEEGRLVALDIGGFYA